MSNVYSEWIEAKANLDRWKRKELELRKSIASAEFPTAVEGTQTFNNGQYIIKVAFKLNHKLNVEEFNEYADAGILSPESIACVGYTPKILLTEYKKLDSVDRKYLDECITSTPATPTLTIKDLGEEVA